MHSTRSSAQRSQPPPSSSRPASRSVACLPYLENNRDLHVTRGAHGKHKGRLHQPPSWQSTLPKEDCQEDRKSTRLNSSHTVISYAVFCLKKKKHNRRLRATTRGQFRRPPAGADRPYH